MFVSFYLILLSHHNKNSNQAMSFSGSHTWLCATRVLIKIKEHTLCGISLCFGTFFLLLFWQAKLEAERKLNDVRALSGTWDFGPEV